MTDDWIGKRSGMIWFDYEYRIIPLLSFLFPVVSAMDRASVDGCGRKKRPKQLFGPWALYVGCGLIMNRASSNGRGKKKGPNRLCGPWAYHE